MAQSEYLRESQVAAAFSIPAGTLRSWRSLGTGPKFIRLAARSVLYRRSDVETWLAARTVTPTREQTP